jgi:intracellular multiplication protein IcmD
MFLSKKIKYSLMMLIGFLIMLLINHGVFAGTAGNWGTVASKITGTFENIGKLITAGSYLAGLGFSIGAIMKFKQHKDNPSQTPVGTPIALVFISAALLFLPSVLASTGSTMFSNNAKTASPKGCTMTSNGCV